MSDQSDEPEEILVGIPSRLRIERHKRRDYTMSAAALAQRRANQPNASAAATGPISAEGKERSRLNALKTGEYAESLATQLSHPCRSTCPEYTASSCPYVVNLTTRPGDRCPVHFGEALDLITAVAEASAGKPEKLRDVLAITTGSTLQIIMAMQQAIAEDGPMVIERISYEEDEKTTKILEKLKRHPLLDTLVKFLQTQNITLGDLLLTPKSKGNESKDDAAAAAAFGAAKAALDFVSREGGTDDG